MQDITKYIEHTNVRPTATTVNIKKLCQEAKKYSFYAVCVSPIYVALAKKKLLKTNIAVVCVVGFPHGGSVTKTKVIGAKQAIKAGADEIDMTMNIQALKDKNYNYVHDDISAVARVVQGKKVKVIIETGYLTHDEIKKAAQIVEEAGAHFVKTCTGYGPRGVRVGDVQLLSQTLKQIGIKASGGIDTYKKVVSMIRAGADRIGTSHGPEIMKSLNH
ncbi:deoxyribose-phosphate aldolase [Patescibacteria group bacterium AH-259-L05]|nr:deoxyribose-phosphate aldolase [Patescibacteria group bacterium AH-259-L05]